MSIRFCKACKDLNVGMTIAVEFLAKKGHKIVVDPNLKLSDDLYTLLFNKFNKSNTLMKISIIPKDSTFVQSKEDNMEVMKIEKLGNRKKTKKPKREERNLIFVESKNKKQEINISQEYNISSNSKIERNRFTIRLLKKEDKKEDKKKEEIIVLTKKEDVREKGVVKKICDHFGFIIYKEEDLFFHNSEVKNKVQIEVGDKVSFIIKHSDRKRGKFIAEQIEIIEKLHSEELLKQSENVKKIDIDYVEWLNERYYISKTIFNNIKLIPNIDNLNIKEILKNIQFIAKSKDDLKEASQFIDILKLDTTINFSSNKLDLNLIFWFLWIGNLENINFNQFFKEFSDQEIINKIILVKRRDDNFKSRLDKLYINLPISIKLHLWLKDIFGEFNYYQFSNYYFTLNSTERRIFNKKAKAMMREEIKSSMLKMKEPWKLIESINKNNNELIEEFSATWKSIWFRDGYIRICIDTEPRFSDCYNWDFSEEKMNLLYDYISGRKLRELNITVVNNKIENISGLEDLEEVIWKIEIQKEIESGIGENSILHKSGSIKIPANMILRNQCIQFLNKLQLSELEPTRVLERAYNVTRGAMAVDISLLYSIPINNYEIAIIWESLELEKAKRTHVFKCGRDEFKNIFDNIEFNLSSQIKIRSKLNSSDYDDVHYQNKLKYITGINHDNLDYNKWQSDLLELLPELKYKI